MSNISQWSTTASSNNSTAPDGWPENMAPSGVNDSARENMAAAAKQYQDSDGSLVTTGTGTAYVLATNSSHAALGDIGLTVFRISTINTGSATLAVDGLVAKTLQIRGVNLNAGDLPQDVLVAAAYNSTNDTFDLLGISRSGLDLNGNELILDADGDTSITADTDDQIDIKIANADDFQFTANDFTALSGSVISTNTINETTAASGVTVDGVILKDAGATFGANIVSDTDSTDDIGTTGVRWANLYVDDIVVTTNVDGRSVSTDGTKLDTIETNADVTDATNVNTAGAAMNTDTSTAAMSFVIDEDGFGSDLDTKVPTQQSTKAYVDAQLIAANALSGALAIGNTTSGNDVVVTAGDQVTTDIIAETTAAAGVTIDGLLIKDSTITSPSLITPALGTPASGVMTNVTGTASGLTAGSVTTNANLTGHVTSTGNAAILGSFTVAQLNTALSDGAILESLVGDTSPQLGGDLDCNGAQVQWSQGADVASGTALAVLTDGNYFDVTGTTTITSINTTGGAGTQIKLHFDGILTLTHHASNLILPGGANITTAAGDEAEFVEYGSGTYRCTNYSKASGEAVVSGGAAGLTLLSTVTASDVATADIETTFDSTYDVYIIQAIDVQTASNSVNILCHREQSSTYALWDYTMRVDDIGAVTWIRDGTSSILVETTTGIGAAAGQKAQFTMTIYNPSSTTVAKQANVIGGGQSGYATAQHSIIDVNLLETTTAAITGIRFLASSGNINGTFKLYGVTK